MECWFSQGQGENKHEEFYIKTSHNGTKPPNKTSITFCCENHSQDEMLILVRLPIVIMILEIFLPASEHPLTSPGEVVHIASIFST
jgi:hypothetical protein